jgi:subtilisin-like proprotein convertase family protein
MKAHGIVSAIVGIGVSLSACTPVYAGDVVCTYSGSFSLRIPADPAKTSGCMVDAIIEVPSHIPIRDLDVTIDITHTNVFDLQLSLKSPSGTCVLLNEAHLDEFYQGANYSSTTFDDEAGIPIEEGQPPYRGTYRPLVPNLLASFDGQDAYGPWQLQVCDLWQADTGTLNSYRLTITAPEPVTAAFLLLGLGLLRGPRRRG